MPLCDSDKIFFTEEQQKILMLRQSPRADHKAIASFTAKQDSSDDAQSILELDESPSETRRRREEDRAAEWCSSQPAASPIKSIVEPDEVIELPNGSAVVSQANDNIIIAAAEPVLTKKPPIKSVRRSKDHHYEDIEDDDRDDETSLDLNANRLPRSEAEAEDECQLVRVVEHQIMDTIEVVSVSSDRSMRASSLKRDRKTPEKKVTFMSSLEDCQITPDGQIVKELVGTKYPVVLR